MGKLKIFSKAGAREIEVEGGELLADLILEAGFFFNRPCAGRGSCGKCKVRTKGDFCPPSGVEKEHLTEKELEAGWRLACQARTKGAGELFLEEGSIETDKIFFQEVSEDALEKGELGLAIDLGTTTVGSFLVSLGDMRIHKGYAVLNEQISFGADILSRLNYASKEKAHSLKLLAKTSIEESIKGLSIKDSWLKRISKAVIVGNSVMHHLFLGLPVERLMRIPFQPESREQRSFKAKLWEKEILVKLPPLLGGFVGSDTLACLVYFGFGSRSEPCLAMDLGTNGEVMLTDGKKIYVASTSAGPAFEGVNIECGMMALPGAITSVRELAGERFELETIGGKKPRGIAGSGLLSLVNYFRRKGKIDSSGRISSGGQRIEIAEGIYLSQRDIREFQKAKSAIRSAVEIVLESSRIKAEELSQLIVTGSFGGKIASEDVISLGLIPRIEKAKVKSLPNGAGFGASMLLDDEIFDYSIELAERVEHIELHNHPRFQELFIEWMKL